MNISEETLEKAIGTAFRFGWQYSRNDQGWEDEPHIGAETMIMFEPEAVEARDLAISIITKAVKDTLTP